MLKEPKAPLYLTTMINKYDAIVIGAGLGGLSAAAHLRGAGHDVTVIERGALPGGRAGVIERDGFRLDNGPTVLTMPGLLADAFAAAGASSDSPLLRSVSCSSAASSPRRGAGCR